MSYEQDYKKLVKANRKLQKDFRKLEKRAEMYEHMRSVLQDESYDLNRVEAELADVNEKYEQLEGDYETVDARLGKVLDHVEEVSKDISSVIRQVEILVGGGSQAKYHELDPKEVLKSLRSWKKDLDGAEDID